eukprot:snap_masked-scaffold_16-processed-gene-2.22-mRNA-1 protein AED:1.00 eAED:1.00 QI:0/0/0/0/1/1/2/0/176
MIHSHPCLLLFEITSTYSFSSKRLEERLRQYVKVLLRNKYDEYTVLNEAQVLVMRNARVGKTSTIQTLFDRSILLNNESTLVLNDVDVFVVNPSSYRWQKMQKYNLSLQRVKNSMPHIIDITEDATENIETKYSFQFENELVSRTAGDELYQEGLRTDTPTYKTEDIYFRVYDFGG